MQSSRNGSHKIKALRSNQGTLSNANLPMLMVLRISRQPQQRLLTSTQLIINGAKCKQSETSKKTSFLSLKNPCKVQAQLKVSEPSKSSYLTDRPFKSAQSVPPFSSRCSQPHQTSSRVSLASRVWSSTPLERQTSTSEEISSKTLSSREVTLASEVSWIDCRNKCQMLLPKMSELRLSHRQKRDSLLGQEALFSAHVAPSSKCG